MLFLVGLVALRQDFTIAWSGDGGFIAIDA